MNRSIKILYLDVSLEYVAPTRNLMPQLLMHEFDVTFFGPGYVDENTLKEGVESFIDQRGYFDFVLTNEHICFGASRIESEKEALLEAYRRNYVVRFESRCVPESIADMYRFFKKTTLKKILIMLETDYYCLTAKQVDLVGSLDCYFFTEGSQFIRAISSLEDLYKEKFNQQANDNWHIFLSQNEEKVISTSQFVGENEFSFGCLTSRKNKIDIPGVNYWARKAARENLRVGGNTLPKKNYQKLYSLLSRFGAKPFSSYPLQKLYNAFFQDNILSSKYVFTCGSGLQYPVRKFFEIPALGSLLICMPCSGFAELGFQSGENFIVATPDQLSDVISDLEGSPSKASRIASAGRELVWNMHSMRARAKQLKLACDSIRNNNFSGAYWKSGRFLLRERVV